MQKVKMEKCLLHLTCGKNDAKVLLKLCMVLNFLYTYVLCFIDCKFFIYFLISCNYVNIMWELYAQKARRTNYENAL